VSTPVDPTTGPAPGPHRDQVTSRVRRLYDRDAPNYDRSMSLVERAVSRRRGQIVADLGGRVLEVAVGTGATLPHYRPGTEVVGIDLSSAMLERARGRQVQEGVTVELREMDAQALEFPAKSFDAVVFTLCLCAIPDPMAALGEALRVARGGAPIRMLEHVRSHLAPVAFFLDLANLISVPLHAEHLNRRTFAAARAAGVANLEQERWGLGIFTLIRGQAPLGDT
jgi:ubiquinone/menaquinone biosynthesis C-methylase UbiE